MKKLLLFLLLFCPLIHLMACTCIETNKSLTYKIKKAFIETDLIITGKIIDFKSYNRSRKLSSGNPLIYKVQVTKIYKGSITKEFIEITTARSGATCGYKFKIGKSYLIYARKSSYYSEKTKNNFDYITGLCDRNQLFKNVKRKELKVLQRLYSKKEKHESSH